jgi:hypothetical protein
MEFENCEENKGINGNTYSLMKTLGLYRVGRGVQCSTDMVAVNYLYYYYYYYSSL